MKKILLIIFIVLAYLNYRYLELGFLQNYSPDEYAFHGSFLNMYEGVMSLDIKKIFTFNFYSYGFGFFALNLFAISPFIAMENWEMAIYIPRLIVSFFAISSIYLIFKIAKGYLDNISSILISLIAISMPGFWINSFMLRPNWMMIFFIILTIYYLSKDAWKYKNNFWWGSISFGLAIATKIQAITFIPSIFLYVFYNNLQNKNNFNFLSKLKLFIKTLLLSFSVFVLTNPYIIHPEGFKAFTNSFLSNLASNKTNHDSAIVYSITEKINNAINPFYFDKYVFFIFILISLFLSLKILKKKDSKNILYVIAFYFFINICYMLIFVNKDWQQYYLPLLIIAPLFLIPLIKKYEKIKFYILIGLLMIQVITYFPMYKIIFLKDYGVPKNVIGKNITKKELMKDISNSLINDLKNHIKKDTNILIENGIPFDFLSIGLSYHNIQIIYGPLQKSMFDLEAYLENSQSKNLNNFKDKEFIILSKGSIYFKKEKLKQVVNKDGYKNARKIVEDFINMGDLGYEIFKKNDYFYIFRKK